MILREGDRVIVRNPHAACYGQVGRVRHHTVFGERDVTGFYVEIERTGQRFFFPRPEEVELYEPTLDKLKSVCFNAWDSLRNIMRGGAT